MKLQKNTLSCQVKELLLDRILKGKYKPGEALVELTIAKELGVSQAPVREAFQALESMRFVETGANRRTRVRQITNKELSEGTLVRGILEESAAQVAAPYLKEHIAELQAEVDGMSKAYQAADHDALIAHAVQFHRVIVTACGNAVLLDVWESLAYEAKSRIYARKIAHEMFAIGITVHQEILDAFKSGDAALACRLVRNQAERSAKFQLEMPQDNGAEQGETAQTSEHKMARQ
jgi:DNA-binding GntR family transcriptional regulator